ncbi:MAG: metal-sulfur cluster assembly factor [Bacteroidota bacterium]
MENNEYMEKESRIISVLKTVFDPEIPVNIYDLGLIYDIKVNEDNIANITMTLTAPNCPMADMIVEEVKYKVAGTKGIKDCNVRLTFDPPWDRGMMTDEAKLELGLL